MHVVAMPAVARLVRVLKKAGSDSVDFCIIFGALRINKPLYKKENKFGAILTIKVQEVF